jgi:hypothetical protein
MSVRMHAHTGTIKLHARPPRPRVTHRIDDRVFEFQRAEMSVGDGGMVAAEVARKGCIRAQVLCPVDFPDGTIEAFGVSSIKPGQLEKHPVRHARPEASAISDREATREGDPSRPLTRVRRAQRNQLPREQIRQPPGSAD